MRFSFNRRAISITSLVSLCFVMGPARAAAQWAAPPPASAFSIPAGQLIQPDELNRQLHARGVERPLVLQVSSRLMFAQAHIPGSEYAGQGAQSEGVERLRGRVAQLPRVTFIVLYCGCCPWNRCPNVGPAFEVLRGMGFTRVKVLYLPDNFGDDWVNKGFPVEGGR
jgi:hypothetical protein